MIAPALAGGGAQPLPADSLAPALADGPRLHPDMDLAQAIADAPDGATIELGPGVYRLRKGVHVTRDLVLNGQGPGRTRVVCDGPDYVLRVLADGALRARGVAFEHEGRASADVLVADAGDLDLADCTIAGGHTDAFPREPGGVGQHGRGLVVAGTASAVLVGCAFERNTRDGLAVLDDAACSVRGWTSRGNRGLGVLAAGRAYLALHDGEAGNNYLGGVAYRDDAHGEAHGARCVRSGGFGIAAFHRARVVVVGAALADNARSGLAWWHSSTGRASGCVIERNGEHGIEVRDDATPQLEGNEVRDNRAWGLVFADRAGGMDLGNVVQANGQGDRRVLDAAGPLTRP